MLCLIPDSIECFSLKITARLVRLYRSYLHFIAFSRICGFSSLLFFLTFTSLQIKMPLATAISYFVLPGLNAGFLCIARTTPGFLSYSVLLILS
jgi:hypothetical protein